MADNPEPAFEGSATTPVTGVSVQAPLVADVGAALRGTFAAWLASAQHGARTSDATAVQLKLVRLTLPAQNRNTPADRRSTSEESPRIAPGFVGIDLEYLAWAEATQPAAEETLIGALLEWLLCSPVQTLEMRERGSGVQETWRLMLTPVALTREEVTRLWGVPGLGGHTLFAFEVRARCDA